MEADNRFTRRVDKLMVFEQPVSMRGFFTHIRHKASAETRKRRYPGNSITNWTNIKNIIYHQAHFRYQTSIVISAQHVNRKSRQLTQDPKLDRRASMQSQLMRGPSPMVPRRATTQLLVKAFINAGFVLGHGEQDRSHDSPAATHHHAWSHLHPRRANIGTLYSGSQMLFRNRRWR